MNFDVALGTSLVVIAFDGENLVTLVGKKSENPYRGAPMLPSNWVGAQQSVEDVAKKLVQKDIRV